MSNLDSAISARGEAPLPSQLDYSITPSSTAIVDRKTCVRAYPVSGDRISPTGPKNINIHLGGDHMLDASTARLMFTIQNLSGDKDLNFLGAGPWCAFSTVRLLSNGTEIDNLDQYGRWHEWTYLTLPWHDQWSEQSVCGWGGSFDMANGLLKSGQPSNGKIQAGEKVTVMMKLNLSLLNSQKLLPLRFMPLELHLTLADSADWISPVSTHSQTYQLTNFEVVYDQCILDEGVTNPLYQSLMNSRILSMPVVRAHQFSRSIASGATTVDVSVQRAYSKVSAIIVSFSGSSAQNSDFRSPSTQTSTAGAIPALDDGSPAWCPSIRVSLGGKNFPDPSPLDNLALFYHQLAKGLGYSPMITRDDFSSDTFCAFFDFKRVPFDHGSALSTRSGDLIRIEIKNLTADRATKVHVVVLSYGSLAVRESGVAILD